MKIIQPQGTESWTGASLVEKRKNIIQSALSFFPP